MQYIYIQYIYIIYVHTHTHTHTHSHTHTHTCIGGREKRRKRPDARKRCSTGTKALCLMPDMPYALCLIPRVE